MSTSTPGAPSPPAPAVKCSASFDVQFSGSPGIAIPGLLHPLWTFTMRSAFCLVLILSPLALRAHDTWVQTNTNVAKTGNGVYVDLMLGNHGNDHRDFKLASKASLTNATFKIHAPN